MFIEKLFQASKSKIPYYSLMGITFFLFGTALGIKRAKFQSQIENQNFTLDHLKQYISEEQIEHEIDQTGKPAVIYYYQPAYIHHYNLRHGFITSSNIAKNNANFYMVNLTKKLQKAIPQLQHKFPMDQYLMEIRFPKINCKIEFTDGQTQEKNTHRRQFFKHQFLYSNGVQNFLQENGIIPPKDPIQNFINITKDSIFSPKPQTQQQPQIIP